MKHPTLLLEGPGQLLGLGAMILGIQGEPWESSEKKLRRLDGGPFYLLEELLP